MNQSNNFTSPEPAINAKNLYWTNTYHFVISNCGDTKITKFPHVMVQKTLDQHNRSIWHPWKAGATMCRLNLKNKGCICWHGNINESYPFLKLCEIILLLLIGFVFDYILPLKIIYKLF